MSDFEEWYEEQRPRVLATCLALCGSYEAAADATDEAFARALERWSRVAAMASPGGWTQTVAINCLKRAVRQQRRRPAQSPPERVDAGGPPDVDLWAAVARLPRRQQAAVVLRYVYDLKQEQIASSMGISRGAVSSTLAAAHANLARDLAVTDIGWERLDDRSF